MGDAAKSVLGKLASRKLFVAVGSLLTVVLAPTSTAQQIAVAAIAAAYVLAQALVDRATIGAAVDAITSGLKQGAEDSNG